MALPESLRLLAGASGSERCLHYDACPVAPGLLVNIDGYSASESLLPWMSLSDWGWKAVVAAASDVAASGGEPLVVFYSVGAPSLGEALEIARGVGEAARWLGAVVAKSDANRCRGDRWIDVAVVGGSPRPVSRRGASPGDYVVQVGYVGPGAVARAVLEGRLTQGDAPPGVLEATRRPRPPVALGPHISRCGASAAADNSDGWGHTLALIAEASGVAIEVERVLVDPEAARALEGLGLDPEEASLASWEDYSLAVTAPGEAVECILEACKRLSQPCEVVGRVARGGPAVYFRGRRVDAGGWESL